MKKGFTLIELLAVIVILAIIAVIAVPIVLNIIDETKDNAGLRSAEMYIKAVELSIANSTLKDVNITDGTYNLIDGDICIGEISNNKCNGELLEVEVNGKVPESGTITITNGNISNLNIVLNEKSIVKNNEGKLSYQEDLQKVCTRQNDEEGFDTVICTIGENTESFYVMNSYLTDASSDKIIMMTKYNIDPTTNRQSSSAGSVAFSSTNYWSNETTYPVDVYDDRNDIIKPIVDNYVSYLNGSLIEDATGSLLTYNQTESLGCSGASSSCSSAPSWVYSTSYWTGSAGGINVVGYVNNEGSFYLNSFEYDFDGFICLRPVITISTSEIQ